MPNNNDNSTLLIVAALGVAGYMYMKNKNQSSPTRRGEVYVGTTEVTDSAGKTTGYQEQIDAVVDTAKTGGNLSDAVETAKGIADQMADAKILIKHEGKHYAIRKGRKKVHGKKHRIKKLRGKKLKKVQNTAQGLMNTFTYG